MRLRATQTKVDSQSTLGNKIHGYEESGCCSGWMASHAFRIYVTSTCASLELSL